MERVDMCEAIQQMVNEACDEAAITFAKKLLALGKLTLEEIAETSGLPLAKIQELASEKTA